MANKNKNVNNKLNFNFLTNNVKGLQSSKKRVKMFEHFKNKIGCRGIFFYKKHILRLTQKNNGMMNLRVNYISLTVKPIHVIFSKL